MLLLWVVGGVVAGDVASGDAVDAAECDGRRPWSIQVAHGTLIRPVCGRFSGFPFFPWLFRGEPLKRFFRPINSFQSHTHTSYAG